MNAAIARNGLRSAAGALLMGDPRPLADLACHALAYRRPERGLLEALGPILRHTNRLEDACEALEREGRADFADLLLDLAADDAIATDRRRPMAYVECMRRQDGDGCVDLLIEGLSVPHARQIARQAVSFGARIFERRRP